MRGADVFLVQSCAPPTNDHLIELLVMAQAARYASARTVTAVLPWYPYARQDKLDVAGEPLSARLVADLLGAAGVCRVVTVDLHVSQIEGFARYPIDHISAVQLLAARVAAIPHADGQLVIVSPDTGRIDTARDVAGLLDASVAMITKERPVQQAARVTGLVGDVHGKTCLLIDDMIDTAGTLCAAGRRYATTAPAGSGHAQPTPCCLRRRVSGCPRASSAYRRHRYAARRPAADTAQP